MYDILSRRRVYVLYVNNVNNEFVKYMKRRYTIFAAIKI